MNLRALRVFRAVAATGSQAAASRTLNIAPSAISRTIGELEGELGFALFRRDRGRLAPTATGRAFALEVEAAFQGFDQLAVVARELRSAGDGRVRAFVPPSLSQRFLPDAIVRFAVRFPNTILDVDYGPASSAIEGLRAGRVDIAVVSLPVDAEGLTVVPLIDVETVCLIPRALPLARKTAIEPADLDGVAVVLINRRFALRERLDELFRRAGAKPRVRVETSSASAAAGCASAGIGVAIVSRLMATQATDRAVVVRPFRPTVWQNFAVVLRKDGRAPAVDGFVRCLRTVAAANRRAAKRRP